MKTAWLLAVMVASNAFAEGVGSGTEFSYPTEWSRPIVLPNGVIVPPVPTRFERRTIGTEFRTTPRAAAALIQANVSAQDVGLLQAAGNGDLKTVTAQLAKGANVNAADNFGNTALLKAATTGAVEVVQLLLDKGADINAVNRDGRTALICAARFNRPKVIELLLARKADPSVLDESGKMAADYTAELRRTTNTTKK